MKQWFLLENEVDYAAATTRYEEVRSSAKNTPEYKEWQLLAVLINKYENEKWDQPELDPIEMIKIRMEDFGYSATDLAREYGDKGTISKVLNYKQSLSLNMIRIFSQMLRLPADALIKEYKLQGEK